MKAVVEVAEGRGEGSGRRGIGRVVTAPGRLLGQSSTKVRVDDLAPPVPELLRDRVARACIQRGIDRRSARYGRQCAGDAGELTTGALVAQPVRDDLEVALGDAEALHHIAQASQRLQQRQRLVADATVRSLGDVARVVDGVTAQIVVDQNEAAPTALRAAVGVR